MGIETGTDGLSEAIKTQPVLKILCFSKGRLISYLFYQRKVLKLYPTFNAMGFSSLK